MRPFTHAFIFLSIAVSLSGMSARAGCDPQGFLRSLTQAEGYGHHIGNETSYVFFVQSEKNPEIFAHVSKGQMEISGKYVDHLEYRSAGFSEQVFDRMMKHFKEINVPIRRIEAAGNTSKQLAYINEATRAGVSIQKAVENSWIARQARRHDFSEVKLNWAEGSPGYYTDVSVDLVRSPQYKVSPELVERYEKNKFFFTDQTEPEFFFIGNVNRGHTLSLNIANKSADGTRSSHIYGAKMFEKMMKHFEAQKTPIERIKGYWVHEDNLAEFNRLTSLGVPKTEAALQTWTGRQAAKFGYTEVRFDKLNKNSQGYYQVQVYFSKPNKK